MGKVRVRIVLTVGREKKRERYMLYLSRFKDLSSYE